MLARILCLLLPLTLSAAPAADAAPAAPTAPTAPTAGVLPVVGARSQALNPSLGRTVAEQGQQAVLGPLELRARLAADPDLAGRLRRAREAIALAKEHELQMNRGAATRAAEQAIRRLEQARAPFFEQQLMTRAYATLALTLLLRPADPGAARAALRRALAVAPDYRPEPGQMPPRAAELLEEERRALKKVRLPTQKDLAWLARRLKLTRLVWLRLERGGKVEMVLYDRGTLRTSTRSVTPEQALPQVARLINTALGGATATAKPDTPWTPSPSPAPPQQPPGRAAWYSTWWVWVIGAAVVAGAAVGVGLAVSQDDASPAGPYDFRFHF